MSTHRLADILAADVVGYSRLMGIDEVATLQALKESIGTLKSVSTSNAVANTKSSARTPHRSVDHHRSVKPLFLEVALSNFSPFQAPKEAHF